MREGFVRVSVPREWRVERKVHTGVCCCVKYPFSPSLFLLYLCLCLSLYIYILPLFLVSVCLPLLSLSMAFFLLPCWANTATYAVRSQASYCKPSVFTKLARLCLNTSRLGFISVARLAVTGVDTVVLLCHRANDYTPPLMHPAEKKCFRHYQQTAARFSLRCTASSRAASSIS